MRTISLINIPHSISFSLFLFIIIIIHNKLINITTLSVLEKHTYYFIFSHRRLEVKVQIVQKIHCIESIHVKRLSVTNMFAQR